MKGGGSEYPAELQLELEATWAEKEKVVVVVVVEVMANISGVCACSK